jgi:hypothetical protein
MTKLLSQAFSEASKLPEADQDEIATRLLAELHDDAAWLASFAVSQPLLERMADEALSEDAEGMTLDLDPDPL